MASRVPNLVLNNGRKMPIIGLGTWNSPPGEVARAVGDAIDVGYRHIDGAHLYLNEHEVGQGLNSKIKEGVVKREDMFITSKLWNSSHDTAYVRAAIDKTLKDLNTPYLDLYLIHWPMAYQPGGDPFPKDDKGDIIYSFVDFVDTWKEMEKAVDEGLIKSIGVSNFNKRQLEKLVANSRIKPVVNQFECHPYLTQKNLSDFCKSINVAVTAYAPLGSPNRPWVTSDDPVLLEDPKILSLTKKYNKTAAQVLIRYQIQRGHSVIPKSVTKNRIQSNFEVFDFELSAEDVALIDTFNCNGRACPQAEGRNHPQWPFNDEY